MNARPPIEDARIAEIKDRIRLSDFIGRTVKLKRSGSEYIGLSPFNVEKTPSFTVNDEKGFYHCFSSGKHGDVIDFVRETQGMSFADAVESLASETGTIITTHEPNTPKPKATVVCRYVYEDANGNPYHRITRKSDKQFPQEYWGINDEVLETYGWVNGKPPLGPIPYHLPDILTNGDQIIHLVEGEKSADYLRSLGLIATTAPGGGPNFPLTDDFAVWFDGQEVRAYPDNDKAGQEWAERVAKRLPHAEIIWLPDQPAKAGADDWLQRENRTVDDLINAGKPEPKKPAFVPTAFELGDPTQIPPRQWMYDFRLIRGFVALTVAPGGLGKSSLAMVDALAMAIGKKLFDDSPVQEKKPLRVWYWNGEDPQEETRRRIAAIALHYKVTNEDIGGRLFTDTGRETEIILGTMNGQEININEDLFVDLETAIIADKIDVLMIDPFSSAHRLPENDNSAINAVARRLAKLADRCNCAVEIVHHTRKTNGAETTVEDGRGASSMRDAVRSARALNVMSYEGVGKELGLSEDDCKSYFSVGEGKASMSSKASGSKWRRLVSVPLGNKTDDRDEDTVGVVVYYEPKKQVEKIEKTNDLTNIEPTILEILARNDMTRHWGGSSQPPKGWLGKAVIERMGLVDVKNGRINGVIKNMLNDGKIVIRGHGEDACYTLPGSVMRADASDHYDPDDTPF